MSRDRKTECLDDLRRRILCQEIAPGSDLDEAALCEAYGISRTPMREVFQRLGGEGYVRITQNRGVKVSSMDLTTMRVFFQTAPLIYCNIARLACENRTEAQLERITVIQGRFKTALEARDAQGASFLNHQFHELIGEMSHNPYLLVALRRMLIDHTRLSQTFYRAATSDDASRVRQSAEQHDGMIAAIAAREADRVVDLTMDHWNLTRDQLERFVMPDPLPLETTPPEAVGV